MMKDDNVLSQAISYAARAHGGQWRKDKLTPYVAHPVRVMMIVCRDFQVVDETILSAAVLHDIIEDTTRDYDSIKFHFGSEVADLVACLSKDPRRPEHIREPEYDSQLQAGPWQARLIKLADCLDNYLDAVDDQMQARAREKGVRILALIQQADPDPVQRAKLLLEKALDSVSSPA